MSGAGLNNGKSAVVYKNRTFTKSYSLWVALHCFQSRHTLVAVHIVHVFIPRGCPKRQEMRHPPVQSHHVLVTGQLAAVIQSSGWKSTPVQRSPLSGDSLHDFNATQHAGLPLPHAAVTQEVLAAREDVELNHTEHPIVVLDQNTEPEGRRALKCGQIRRSYCLNLTLIINIGWISDKKLISDHVGPNLKFLIITL